MFPVANCNDVEDMVEYSYDMSTCDFQFEIDEDGPEKIETTTYWYEDGTDPDGTVRLSATADGTQRRAALYWYILMEKASYGTRTYIPTVAIGQLGDEAVVYAECMLDYGDGTRGWRSCSPTYGQYVYMVYPDKYYEPGSYTITAVSAYAEFSAYGSASYPGTGFRTIVVEPDYVTVS